MITLRRFTFSLSVCALLPSITLAGTSEFFGPMGIRGELQPGWPKKPEAIKVIKAEEDSPASGKLSEGDVIVGIGNEPFQVDPRAGLNFAIDLAETKASQGRLPLLLESGKTVIIDLPVIGSYGPSAPYDCSKSLHIIEQAAAGILADKKMGSSPTRTDWLGLMATGKKEHLDAVAKAIHESEILDIDPDRVDAMLKGGPDMGLVGWYWGYNLIALGEYYLLSGDKKVLPAIRTYSMGLARGQDPAGLWGHRMATAKLGGRLPGYAQMNQSSLSNFLGMIIARKCGIQDPVLDQAIATTHAYVADHADKGGFPYGVHGPQPTYFDNNGMSGLAAVCMSLQGQQKEAKYFSQIVATTHDSLTQGHASPFFNPLWSPLGASLSGPEVTHQFFMKSLWFFNGKRHWEGGFPGRGNTGSDNGQALLMYCLPRKVLLITGREADPSIWVSGKEATEVVMRSQIAVESKTTEELVKALEYPLTQVSFQAAKLLTNRMRQSYQNKEKDSIMPQIMKLVENGSESARISAMFSFGNRCPYDIIKPHAEKLGSILRDPSEPLAVRIAAATALAEGRFEGEQLPYYNDVLKLVFEEHPNDPFAHMLTAIAKAAKGISPAPFEQNLVTDKVLVYKAALKFMDHKRQVVRGVGLGMLRGMPLEDFYNVADDLAYTLGNKDPNYHSYHNALEIGIPGIETLASLGIREGLDYLVDLVMSPSGKWGFKKRMIYQTLPLFGGNAKPYIAKLEEHSNLPGRDKDLKNWEDLVRAIEEDKDPRELISLAEAISVWNCK